MTGSTLSSNTAGGSGGGIHGGQGSASRTITNTTLSGNSAGEDGGGIYNGGGTLTLTNNTLVGNSAVGSGGGISNGNFSTLLPGNNLVIGNTAKDITTSIYNYGTVRSKGHNLFGANNNAGLWGFIPNDSDLLLTGAVSTAIGPLADNGGPTQTHLPVVGSPAINAGDNTLIPTGVTTDQRGYGPRIVGSAVDIGAVEVGALPPDQALIEEYYQAILGRASDAAGLAAWTSEADRARSLGLDIKEVFRVMANVFFTSAEYLGRNRDDTQYITDLYQTFFNRSPDSSGLAYWTQTLTDGLPRSVVLFSFLFSSEFENTMQSLFGTTTTRSELATVGDFYRGFLNRLPDNDGFAFWLGRFRTAQCTNAAAVRADVESISSQYLAGAEYSNRQRSDRDFVADLYYVFLRRGGDVNGFNFWVNQLGSSTRDQVRQQFVNASEFQTRVNQIISQGCAP